MLKWTCALLGATWLATSCGRIAPTIPSSDLLGSRAGNGGEFAVEQPWTRLAKEVRDALAELDPSSRHGYDPDLFWQAVGRTVLRVERDVGVIQPDGRTAAKNVRLEFPATGPVLTIDVDWFKNAPVREIIGAVLHEYGQVMGLESDSYEASVELIDPVTAIYWRKNADQPVLLSEIAYDTARAGVSWDEAKRLCATYKDMYAEKYFLVYCEFHEKNWQDVRYGTAFYRDFRFLGYETVALGSRVAVRGFFFAASAESAVTHVAPRWAVVDVPYTFEYRVPRQIYGLRIYAFGRLGPDVREKEVLRSDDLDGSGTLVQTYPSKIKAMVACKQALYAVPDAELAFKYYRSRCTAEPAREEPGRYVFVIRSKNPFLP